MLSVYHWASDLLKGTCYKPDCTIFRPMVHTNDVNGVTGIIALKRVTRR